MDKLTQVIDMIEHPEHYSESQIKEILQDEESRQTYLTMILSFQQPPPRLRHNANTRPRVHLMT